MQAATPAPPNLNSNSNANTQAAAFQMLMNAIGSLLSPVVHQLISSDPSLIHIKGWHGMTALHRACLIGDYNIVLILIEANSDVNAANDFDETPLHYASKRGAPTVVHLLVQCGAKMDARDRRGRTVLHHASENGCVDVMKYYEDAFQMTFRDVDSNYQSPMHILCTYGHMDAFNFLLAKNRSDLLQADFNGNLPIHISAKEGFGHMTWLQMRVLGVQALHIKNKSGCTPVELVMQNDSRDQRELAPVMRYYERQSDFSKIDGPVYKWYFLLCYPFLLYLVLVLISHHMETHRFIPFLVGFVGMVFHLKGAIHRMNDISRWPNPAFAGVFAAGICHSMICYFYLMFPYVYYYSVVLALSVIFPPALFWVYIKLMRKDPGIVTTSATDESTGKLLNLVDLCKMRTPTYRFCSVCDIVTNTVTKHCRLCNVCLLHMDHHCLFVLKCVATNNHVLFLWLIILAFINMVLFCVAFYIYASVRYYQLDYYSIALEFLEKDCWPLTLLVLNVGSSMWSANLIYYQYNVVSKGSTSYFMEEFHRDKVLTTQQRLTNFVNFLLNKPLPHRNPYSPFEKKKPPTDSIKIV